jgi:hypothetical protein
MHLYEIRMEALIAQIGFRKFPFDLYQNREPQLNLPLPCFMAQDSGNVARAFILERGYDQLRRRATSRGNGPSWYARSDTLSVWR